MMGSIEYLNPQTTEELTVRRELPKKILCSNKPEGFSAKLDTKTLCYGALRRDEYVEFYCPKLWNLEEFFRAEIQNAGGKVLKVHRHARWDHVRVQFNTGLDAGLKPLPRLTERLGGSIDDLSCDQFAGSKCLVTVSKNNRLNWIFNWARFHKLHYGINSCLLIDNGSDRYSPDELVRVLESAGLDEVLVLYAGVPYGPILIDRDQSLCFFQTAILNYVKQKYLAKAEVVLSLDVDELLISQAFPYPTVRHKLLGMGRFKGRWVHPDMNSLEQSKGKFHVDHFCHSYMEKNAMKGGDKYYYFPKNMPRLLSLDIHGFELRFAFLRKAIHFFCKDRSSEFRHFRAITTSWKGVRSIHSTGLAIDKELVKYLAKVK